MKNFIVSFQVDERSLSKIDDAARLERKNRSKWIRDALLRALPTDPERSVLTSTTNKEQFGTTD